MKQILSCAYFVIIAAAATVLFVVALPLAALAEQNLSLDGTWRFSFQGGEERDMPVPSCWELQGVGTLRYGEADGENYMADNWGKRRLAALFKRYRFLCFEAAGRRFPQSMCAGLQRLFGWS